MRKNIAEDILFSFLERNLSLKFDICKCELCKKKMMEYLLLQFPPCYVEDNDPGVNDIRNGFISKNFPRMFSEVKKAIEQVSADMPHPREEDKDKSFDLLLARIRQDRGVDFSQYFKGVLKRRIALRMLATKSDSYMDYLKILSSSPDEYEELFNVLTINVSEFFRDPPVWLSFEKILKEKLKEFRDQSKPLRIWSAGCALGQEPYSLAMLVNKHKSFLQKVSIYATDVDRECMAKAKAAVYNGKIIDRALENTEETGILPGLLDNFEMKDCRYYLKEKIKGLVSFQYLDLTSSAYLQDIDIILCRNVFIYFMKGLQEQILDRFYRSLVPGGYLFIGNTETMPPEAATVFQTIDSAARIYQSKK